MVVHLQRAVKYHLGAKYWKCNKRDNVYISELLSGNILHEIERNSMINSLVWVIVF